MNIIFVDYPDGAGGEFLSYFISLHQGFYRGTFIQTNGRHNYGANILNFLNNQARVIKKDTWGSDVHNVLQELKKRLADIDADSICIPFHCFYNKDYKNIKSVFPQAQILSIRPDSLSSYKLIKLELIRKTALIKYNLKDTQFYWKLFADKIIDFKNFIGIDVFLLTHHYEINQANRNLMLNLLLNRPFPIWDECDYVLSWENFFKNLEHMDKEYLDLCDFLALTPDTDILDLAKKRNCQNLNDLMSYNIKNEAKKFGLSI